MLCIVDTLLSTIGGNALDPFVSLEIELLVALADNLFWATSVAENDNIPEGLFKI